jgi:hypothetical protein
MKIEDILEQSGCLIIPDLWLLQLVQQPQQLPHYPKATVTGTCHKNPFGMKKKPLRGACQNLRHGDQITKLKR